MGMLARDIKNGNIEEKIEWDDRGLNVRKESL